MHTSKCGGSRDLKRWEYLLSLHVRKLFLALAAVHFVVTPLQNALVFVAVHSSEVHFNRTLD